MKPKSSNAKSPTKAPAERVVKDIRRQTRRHFSAEDKIRIVLEGLRGEDSIATSRVVYVTTTGRRIRICRSDDESGKCRGSSRRARPSASFPPTVPSTTISTSSDISSHERPCDDFDLPPWKSGSPRPPLTHECASFRVCATSGG